MSESKLDRLFSDSKLSPEAKEEVLGIVNEAILGGVVLGKGFKDMEIDEKSELLDRARANPLKRLIDLLE